MRSRKVSAIKKILVGAQIPPSAVGIESRIELNGRREVVLEGCEAVLEYTSERAVMRMCDGVVSICGSGLEMANYGDGTVTLSGKMSDFTMLDE